VRDGVQASMCVAVMRASVSGASLTKCSRSFAGFAFLQSVIGAMVQHNNGAGGSVLVTGATSSTRGREGFAG